MLPAYIGYLSGTSAEAAAGPDKTWYLLKHSLSFVTGFSTTVIALGIAAILVGKAFGGWMGYAGVVGGVLLLVLGLQRLGVLRLPWLHDAGFSASRSHSGRATYWRSYLTGFTLAFGWQVTLIVALTLVVGIHGSFLEKLLVLILYSIGFSAMFMMTFVFSKPLVAAFRRLGTRMVWVDRMAGVLMLLIAVVLITTDGNLLKTLADWKTGPIITSLFHGRI
ncbi:MAG: hypothetical protein OWT28_07195 [Firmicutes bacterium]|nr:hypothetical protein [Bacillota bacterium]